MVSIVLSGNVIIDKPIIIKNEDTLTVNLGTNIIFSSSSVEDDDELSKYEKTGSILVAVGGTAFFEGTQENPITINHNNITKNKWYGITICGKNKNTPPSYYNGLSPNSVLGKYSEYFKYGNWNEFESITEGKPSIYMDYVEINNAGKEIILDLQNKAYFDALSIQGLGNNNSSIGNIKILNSLYDGLDINGGGINLYNISIENAGGHCLDITTGGFVEINNLIMIQKDKLNHIRIGNKLVLNQRISILYVQNCLTNGVLRIDQEDYSRVNISGLPNNNSYNTWGKNINDFGVTNQYYTNIK